MKTITTGKGEFVVVELDTDQKLYELQDMFGYGLEGISTWFKLSEATEDDAKLIVDNGFFKGFYTFDGWGESEDPLLTLECLLKSNNITGDNLYIFKKI